MTVHFIDPPGALANTSEPLDFTTTYPVTSVSVEFNPEIGNGARETVWDGVRDDGTGGDFSYAYRASTRSVDGLTWQIKRALPWPTDLRLRVKEAAPASQGGVGLGVIYEVDFTVQPAALFDAPGAYVVDGKTWWAKGSRAGSFGSVLTSGVHGGVGLGMRETNGGTGNHEGATAGNVTLAQRHLFMPLAQLAGYNPAAPLVLRYKATGSNGGNASAPCVGLVDCTNDTVPLGVGQRRRDHYIDHYGGASVGKRGTVFGSAVAIGTLDYRNVEWGIYHFLSLYEVALYHVGVTAGLNFSDINDMDTVGSEITTGQPNPFYLGTARSNTGILIAFDGQVDTTPTGITHLQILQPRNP